MKKLIEDNYISIVRRGLITPETKYHDFYDKLCEEVEEVYQSENDDQLKEELADVILTALNWARHYNFDIETELKKKIIINQNR